MQQGRRECNREMRRGRTHPARAERRLMRPKRATAVRTGLSLDTVDPPLAANGAWSARRQISPASGLDGSA